VGERKGRTKFSLTLTPNTHVTKLM